MALAVRLIGLPATSSLGPRIADEQHYDMLASSLADGHGFATPAGPTSLRPPLYPAFVAAIWMVTGGRSLQAVRVAQFGLAVVLTVAVFAIARDLFGSKAALVAAAIAAFYPPLFVANYLLLTEVLFATLLACGVWATIRAFVDCSPSWGAAAGVLVALAALTRSVVYPLPIVLALLALLCLAAPLARRLALAAAIVVAAAVVLAPWAIRNTRLQHVPVLVDTMGGMNLRMGNYEYTPHDRIWDAVSMAGERSWIHGYPEPPGEHWTEGQKERWARGEAIRFMLAHPGLTTWRALIKFGDFWALDRDFAAGVQHGLYAPPLLVTVLLTSATLVTYPLVLVLAIVGLGRLGTANWPRAWLPLVVTLFVCALHTIVFGHPRYRLPLMPLLGIYAGAALAPVTAAAGRTSGWRSALVPAAGAAAFAILWSVQFAWRDWPLVERLLASGGGVR